MSEHPLTKKEQVLAAVAAGCVIEKVEGKNGLLRLMDGDREVRAWLTALQSAARALEVTHAPR